MKGSGPANQDLPISGPTKQEIVLKNFADAGVHCFALQETRLQRIHWYQDDRYFLFRSAATKQGVGGMLLAFSKTLPYATTSPGGRQLFWNRDHFGLVSSSARSIIVRVLAPGFKCIVVAGHAPHTGASFEDIQAFWDGLRDAIPQRYKSWPVLSLTDANARIGSERCNFVGAYQAEVPDNKSEAFLGWVREMEILLPSTFELYQHGPGETWTHSSGRQSRIDFVGLPLAWHLSRCTSWVDVELEFGTASDHRPAMVEVHYTCVVASLRPQLPGVKLHFDVGSAEIGSSLPVEWDVDVSTHAAHLQEELFSELRSVHRHRVATPMKKSLSPSTWQLILDKKVARCRLREWNQHRRVSLLRACFVGWSRCAPGLGLSADASAFFTQHMAYIDREIAVALFSFRTLGRQVTAGVRDDDRHYFEEMLKRGGELLHPTQAKSFWKVIRNALPQTKAKKSCLPPLQNLAFEEEWQPYFESLEAGSSTTVEDLVQSAVSSVPSQDHVGLLPIDLLPSRVEIEDSLRSTQPDRATGLDVIPTVVYHSAAASLAPRFHALFMKSFAWGVEPIQYKGGQMAVIAKKPHPAVVSHFRGIMLLGTPAKRLHGLLRSRLMNVLASKRPPGQLGGFAEQNVIFGSHTLRTFMYIADSQNLCSAVLFLDIANAYHRLIREFVVGVRSQENVNDVTFEVPHGEHIRHYLLGGTSRPSLLQQMGVHPRLIRLVQDVHHDTWCTINQKDLFVTKRGTCPGSPIADCVWHILMADLIRDLDVWLLEHPMLCSVFDGLGISPFNIVWADDVALPLVANSGPLLIDLLKEAMAFIHELFGRKGLPLNLALGKTSALVTFKGRNAPELRKEFLLTPRPGFECPLPDGAAPLWLHCVPHYKHLGSMLTADRSFDLELSCRLGAGKQAFATLARPVLANRHLPERLRVRLFNALIMTKVFFGCGSWPVLTQKQMGRLQSVVVGMLRRVLRRRFDPAAPEGPTTILLAAGYTSIRAKLAEDRLLYARHFFRVAPEFAQTLMHQESRFCRSSWLAGLQADLEWLSSLTEKVPSAWATDMSALFEWWQEDHLPCVLSWKSVVRRAHRLHLLQERMMADVHHLQGLFYQTLRQHGATFRGEASHSSAPTGDTFYCHCGGGGNPRYNALVAAGMPDDHWQATIAPEWKGQARFDALQCAGPVAPLIPWQDHVAAALRIEVDQLEASLHLPDSVFSADDAGHLYDVLHRFTQTWLRCVGRDLTDQLATAKDRLCDGWLQLLSCYPEELHSWVEFGFLEWGRYGIEDLLSFNDYVDAATALVDAFGEFADVLPRSITLQHIGRLRCRLRSLDDRPPLDAHRPVYLGPANASERRASVLHVPRALQAQVSWLASLRKMCWEDLPPVQPFPLIHIEGEADPFFLVVHLFAGRRRDDDFHCQLVRFCEEAGLCVRVLSLDTAVSPVLGDLSFTGNSWQLLWKTYLDGYIAATMNGSPCETFSEARHQPPPEGVIGRWPRPLRSRERLFGYDLLRRREYEQLRAGSCFFLQGLGALGAHMVNGGMMLSEHPAPPKLEERASIWTSPPLELARSHPLCHLHVLGQWHWGASVVKPTGLLAYDAGDVRKTMWKHADPEARFPSDVAIGKSADEATFKTAKHKEYPTRFNAGLAWTITQRFLVAQREQQVITRPLAAGSPLATFLREYEVGAVQFRESWLPDWQG
eukprot:Skav202654  [mRNA]  locus=scaffold1228:101431:106659:+ [translate_table: standard]